MAADVAHQRMLGCRAGIHGLTVTARDVVHPQLGRGDGGGIVTLPGLVQLEHRAGHAAVDIQRFLQQALALGQPCAQIRDGGHTVQGSGPGVQAPGKGHVQLAFLQIAPVAFRTLAVKAVQEAVGIDGVQAAQHVGMEGIAQHRGAAAAGQARQLDAVALVEGGQAQIETAALEAFQHMSGKIVHESGLHAAVRGVLAFWRLLSCRDRYDGPGRHEVRPDQGTDRPLYRGPGQRARLRGGRGHRRRGRRRRLAQQVHEGRQGRAFQPGIQPGHGILAPGITSGIVTGQPHGGSGHQQKGQQGQAAQLVPAARRLGGRQIIQPSAGRGRGGRGSEPVLCRCLGFQFHAGPPGGRKARP